MATYPLLAHRVTLESAVTATVTLAGVEDDITIPAGTYYGIGPVASGVMTSDALPRAFATALIAHSEWPSTPTLAMGIQLGASESAPMAWRATYSGGGLSPSDTFAYEGSDSTVFDKAIGLVEGGSLPIGTLGYIQSSTRYQGVWSPGALGTRAEPVYVDLGEGAISPYDASAHDRLRLGRRMLWVCEWPYVEAADISRELAALSAGYMTLAGRESEDTLGTLDDLLGACGSGSRVRLMLAENNARDCVLDTDGTITRSDYTTEETVGGRRYRVSLPLVQASVYGGVAT